MKGKAVAVQIAGAPTDGISYRRYVFGKLTGQAGELIKAGAVAVVFVSDAPAQAVYDHWSHIYERGRYSLPGAASTKVMSHAARDVAAGQRGQLGAAGRPAAHRRAESGELPATRPVNIVAKMPGTDAQLKQRIRPLQHPPGPRRRARRHRRRFHL
ncbi:MAG: hypothetical protein WKG07_31410 [Hymenobacter sp.]